MFWFGHWQKAGFDIDTSPSLTALMAISVVDVKVQMWSRKESKISVKQIPIVLLLPFICDYCLSLNHHQENDSQHFASLWGPDRGGPTFNTISLQKCFIKSDLGNVSEEGHR